jgi:hypothetical protein
MIQMPRRSVTRFFIPLIDVLTLLFCVFLVMPLAKGTGEDTAEASNKELKDLRAELDRLHGLGADEPEKIRQELEELRKAKGTMLMDQIFVRVLEIDGATGELSYRGGSGRVPIRSENDLLELLKEDRLRSREKREVIFQILYPPDPYSSYPTTGQRRIIESWFAKNRIAYKFVVPVAERES